MKIDLEKADAEKSPNYVGKTLGRSWKVESMQRNFIKEAYKNFSPSDIIIISDLDEIPSKDKLSFIKSCTNISGADALAVIPMLVLCLRLIKSNFSNFSSNILSFAPYC